MTNDPDYLDDLFEAGKPVVRAVGIFMVFLLVAALWT